MVEVHDRVASGAWRFTATVGTLAAAGGMAVVLHDRPPPLTLVVAGGIGMLTVLAIAIVRYEAAVVLGVLLLPVVIVEPAPSDAIFATAIAVAVLTGRMRLRRIPLGIGALIGALIALNLLSAVFAVDPQRAAAFLTITFYLALFSAWLTTYVDSRARARTLLLALFAGGAASSVIGIAALFVSFPGGSLLLKFGRVRGLFEDPNVFGPFMALLAILAAAELLEPQLLRWRRAWKITLFGVFAAGVLFAYSRAAWLNAAAAVLTLLGVYALRRGGGRRAFYLLISVVTAVAALALALAVTNSVGFLEERARFQSYDVERFHAQAAGFGLVAHYPFGVGPGQFERFVEISAHSLYVRALAEQGVLGLVVILLIVFGTLLLGVRNVVAGRDTFGIGSAPLLAAWVGLVANSAFVDTLHWRHLWLVAALIWTGAVRRA